MLATDSHSCSREEGRFREKCGQRRTLARGQATLGCVSLAACVLLFSAPSAALAQQQTSGIASATVEGKEYDTGEPISQARITLEFSEARALRRPKKISYNAKTDAHGRCKFTEINKGPIVLMVTADGHQSYGKELQLEQENQVFVVRLKRPQPLL